nr:TerD family protein [Actinomadura sp. RB99]
MDPPRRRHPTRWQDCAPCWKASKTRPNPPPHHWRASTPTWPPLRHRSRPPTPTSSRPSTSGISGSSRRRHRRPTRSPPPRRPRRAHIHRVVVSVNMDVDTGLTCAALTNAYLEASCITGAAWHFPVPADPTIKAMVTAEFYRHTANDVLVWKLRAVGQGWSDGLDGLARAYGVQVD